MHVRPKSGIKFFPEKRTEHGMLLPCSVDSFPDRFSSRELSLLQRRAGNRRAGTRRRIPDHAGLVREEHALTGGANVDRGSGDRIADRRRIAVARPGEYITAL